MDGLWSSTDQYAFTGEGGGDEDEDMHQVSLKGEV